MDCKTDSGHTHTRTETDIPVALRRELSKGMERITLVKVGSPYVESGRRIPTKNLEVY